MRWMPGARRCRPSRPHLTLKFTLNGGPNAVVNGCFSIDRVLKNRGYRQFYPWPSFISQPIPNRKKIKQPKQ